MTFDNVRVRISKTVFPLRAVRGFAFIAALLLAGHTHAANILTNSGFETGDFTGWTTFGGNNYVQSGGAHSGVDYYKVYGAFNTTSNYTGVYQDIPSTPGAAYTADGWALSLSSDGGGIHGSDLIWLEVSFRDASKNALALYRSDVVDGANIANYGGLDTWFDLQITNQCSFTNPTKMLLFPGTVTNTVTNLVAPAGTVYARYQTVFAQGPDNANGSMYFDDLKVDDGTVAPPPPPVTNFWNIVWSDEFNGTSLNTGNWTYDTNTGPPFPGWGNNEWEYYTSRTNNVYVADGFLHIHAQQDSNYLGSGYNYTSGRIKSRGLFSHQYGRFEWRAQLPAGPGAGFWPGLWMLPQSSAYGGWPNEGEIDVVESHGNIPNQEGGTIHYGGANGNDVFSGQTYTFPSGDGVTNFHTYRLEWTSNRISWAVDGQVYETQTNWWSNMGTSTNRYPYPAPFNEPFYILMNMAIGGNYFNGQPITTNSVNANMPGEMLVDYVRVYDQTPPLQISAAQSNGNVVLTWPTNIVCHLQTQTNSLVDGNWFDSSSTSPVVISPDPNSASVFFRLASP